MKYSEWAPVYYDILTDFGFEQVDDEHAREVLATLTQPTPVSPEYIQGRNVLIAGAAPSLEEDMSAIEDHTIVAASDAGVRLADNGILPEIIVTDLDGEPEQTANLVQGNDILLVVHGHGDNIETLKQWLPIQTAAILPTTQTAPAMHIQNFGGFTDGDRAAFLADHFDAQSLSFIGWSFTDPTVTDAKRQKLDWAAKLLHWLEIRRQEQFDILDQYRDTLSLPSSVTESNV